MDRPQPQESDRDGETSLGSQPAARFGRRIRRVIAGVVACALVSSLLVLELAAPAGAATRAFALRYSADLAGDITFAANTILTCPASATCTNVQNGTTAGANNNYAMVAIDADVDPSTFNSSSSGLNLPAGSTVQFAGLYWGAVSTAVAAQNVKFKTPGSTSYTTVTATTFDTTGSAYSAFANVTGLVAAAGNGEYWAADIRATIGAGAHGGWALVVQYSYPGSKMRNCSVFDGLESVGSGNPRTINVSGFRTPPTGTVNTKLGVVAYEGDRGNTGDALSLNGTVMSDGVNPANDFFNSSVTSSGSHVTTRTPRYINTLGFDADIINVPNAGNSVIANNATSASIRLSSSGDVYYPSVVTFCTELYAPQIVSGKTGVDTTPGTPLLTGDEIEYTIDVRNTGLDPAISTIINDPIPTWTTYVPGSMRIVTGPGAGTVTDQSADDRGEFTGSTVRFRVGVGSSATAGGTIPEGQPETGPAYTTVSFRVRLNSDAPDGVPITNQASIDFRGLTLNAPTVSASTAIAMTISNTADLSVTKTDAQTTADAGTSISYVVTYRNNSTTIGVTNAAISDPLPTALTGATWTCSGAACHAPSGSGSLNTTLSLPPLATVAYTITGTISPTFTGSLSNTATITAPPGTTDPNTSNNSATDVDTVNARGDLSITKSDGVTTVQPGDVVTWTIVASNTGPSTVVGATVGDTFPTEVRSATWTCSASSGSSCPASGSGSIAAPVTLTSGGSATFTVSATVDSRATGSLVNTATIAAPVGFSDSVLGNNTATDTDTIQPVSDLSVAKSHTPSPIVPGQPVVWTIAVTNAGPSAATSASLTDSLPTGFAVASVSSSTWSCTNTASSVDCTTTDLPVGTSTVQVVTSSDPAFTGVVSNSATVTSPTDPNASNNTGTDTSTVSPNADVQISKSHNPAVLSAGSTATWQVQVSNAGPSTAANVLMTDAMPPGVTVTAVSPSDPAWSCSTDSSQVVTCSNASLAVGASATFTISGTLSGSLAAGTLSNTATVTTSTVQNTANDTATDVATVVAEADLSIGKSRVGTLVSGNPITYTVTVVNNGPATVTNAQVNDAIPPQLGGATWTCAATGSGSCGAVSGSGNVATNVALRAGEQAQFTISATALPTASGAVTNTATVTAPAGITDPNTTNNSSTDSTNAAVRTALSISKSNSQTDVTPGTVTRYEVVVTNAGPSTATAAPVVDTLPAAVTSATWTCSASGGSCSAPSGTGSINSTVTLSPGSSATFVVLATISPNATGTLVNTATVSAPAGATDPDLSNNSATDTDTLTPYADVSVTKTDTKATAVPGTDNTYTITLNNAGPSTAAGVAVSDPLSTMLTGATWTCTASAGSSCLAASGSGAIGTEATIAPAGAVTYTVTGTIDPAARGVLTNTVNLTMPAGTIDPASLDLTATDTTELTPTADISLTKSATPTIGVPGQTITYEVTVSNAGPSTASQIKVNDPLPMGLSSATWTCAASSGSACAAATGSGAIDADVDLLATGTATFTVTATIDASATGTVTNIATATLPAGVTDPTPGSNEARVTTTLEPQADVSIVKTSAALPAGVTAGQQIIYTLTVSNSGPSAAPGTAVTDSLPPELLNASWTCTADASSSCPASGDGNILTTVDLGPGGSVTFTMTADVNPATSVTQTVNSASVAAPAGVIDPDSANNTSEVTVPVRRSGDLSVTKTLLTDPVVAGLGVTWTVTVSNTGPSTALAARVVDTLPTSVTATSWSCGASPGSSCADGGSTGDIDTTVDLLAGGSAVFTIVGTLDRWTGADRTETLSNTATVTEPAGFTDPDPANNTSTASAPVSPVADIELAKTNLTASSVPGTSTTYTIVALNRGPSAVKGLTITDPLLSPFAGASATWDCKTSLGVAGACSALLGTGPVNLAVNLDVSESATITITVPIASSATGTLANTATAATTSFTTDPVSTNNSATDTDDLTPIADLSVTKTDGSTTAIPGQPFTYTIIAANAGPSDAPGTQVTDLLPSGLLGATWTCTASASGSCGAASGSGSINSTVDLPVGTSATFLVTGTVDPALTGTISNEASVAPATGVTDPSSTNNSSTDTNTLVPTADVSVTKTNSAATHVPGMPVTYSIVVTNSGPSNAPGTHVIDALSAPFSNPTWTCTTSGAAQCSEASGSTAIDTYADLPAGSSATYTLTVDVDENATGNQTNSAQALTGAGITDPNATNNTAVDVDLLTPAADLSVTKTHSPTNLVPGEAVEYTIVVANSGPSAAPGVSIDDALPAALVGATWTCTSSGSATCSASSGSGSPTLQASLPKQTSVTITVNATIDQFAVGLLENTVDVRLPSTVIDPTPGPVPGLTSATDSARLSPAAGLAVTKTDRSTRAVPGERVTYIVEVSNAGPSAAPGVGINDTLPIALTAATWTCSSTTTATCATASGAGDVATTADLPAGTSVTVTVTGIVDSTATGSLTNTASIAVPTGVLDSDTSDNASTDVNTLTPVADLQVTKTRTPASVVPGQPVAYEITVVNNGPSAAPATAITDPMPAALDNATWTCTAAGGATCSATSGSGSISTTADLPAGSSASYSVVAAVDPAATGTLENVASAVPASGISDPTAANATATNTTTLVPTAALSISKQHQGALIPGTTVTYEIVVRNDGPSDAPGVEVVDDLPTTLLGASWTCSATTPAVCGSASGAGSINQIVNLPAGTRATYTVTGTLDPTATGTLSNTARVIAPTGVTDTQAADNSSTDSGPVAPTADLSIVKTHSPSVLVPGQSATYTLVVRNDGPSAASNVRTIDHVPAEVDGVSWSCSTTTGTCGLGSTGTPGSNTLDALADLPPGATVTYTATGTLRSGTTGSITNVATVFTPAGVTDPNGSNNTADDNTATNPTGDVSVVKTITSGTLVPGGPVTYSIVVSNAGPSDTPAVDVSDILPAAITAATWTCSGAGSATCGQPTGSGDVEVSVNLPAVSTATITVTGNIDPAATGTLTNRATATLPVGITNVDSSDDEDTASAPLVPTAHVTVTKTRTPLTLTPGLPVSYSIVVANNGPSTASGIAVSDTVPAGLAGARWICTATPASSCAALSGLGDLSTTATIAPAGSVTYTLTATVDPDVTGEVLNTAAITLPSGLTDPDPSAHSSTIGGPTQPQIELSIAKTDHLVTAVPGATVTYEILVTNAGPSTAVGARVLDALPGVLRSATWTCTTQVGSNVDPASSCAAAAGTSSIDTTVTLVPNASAVFTLTGTIDAGATGSLSNTATVTAGAGQVENDTADNMANDTDTLQPSADLSISKSNDTNMTAPGTETTYTLTVTNPGPSDAAGIGIVDTPPSELVDVRWSCVGCTTTTGTGAIATGANLAAGTTAVVTVTGMVASTATGTLANSANVVLPPGVSDTNPTNNEATDTDILRPTTNIEITKTHIGQIVAGKPITYEITVVNRGPSQAQGVRVLDPIPSGLIDATWTCETTNSACSEASGTNTVDTLINLPVDGQATITMEAVVSSAFAGTLTNEARAYVAAGSVDPSPDNVGIDSGSTQLESDLRVAKRLVTAEPIQGGTVEFEIVVSNAGPSDARGVAVIDELPPDIRHAVWTCTPQPNAVCTSASGPVPTNGLLTTVDLANGSSATLRVIGVIGAAGSISNTARVVAPAGISDPDTDDNTSMVRSAVQLAVTPPVLSPIDPSTVEPTLSRVPRIATSSSQVSTPRGQTDPSGQADPSGQPGQTGQPAAKPGQTSPSNTVVKVPAVPQTAASEEPDQPSIQGDTLAFTGNGRLPLLLSLACMIVGGVLVLATRRRRARS